MFQCNSPFKTCLNPFWHSFFYCCLYSHFSAIFVPKILAVILVLLYLHFSLNRGLRELKETGVVVVDDVISQEDCDVIRGQYSDWLTTFPETRRSIIRHYSIGHLEPTWTARVKVKPLYELIWDTEKLLTSFDCIAIGR